MPPTPMMDIMHQMAMMARDILAMMFAASYIVIVLYALCQIYRAGSFRDD